MNKIKFNYIGITMKIGYWGSPSHSAELLERLITTTEHSVEFVITNIDKPQGRGRILEPTFVKRIALKHNIPVFHFESVKQNEEDILDILRKFNVDIQIIYAFGQIIPSSIFNYSSLKSINLHGSLLPDLRGASPVQTSILKGYSKTGITIQYLTDRMDAGDVLSKIEIPIELNDNTNTLLNKITQVGGDELIHILSVYRKFPYPNTKQNEQEATYCKKLTKESRKIDVSISAWEMHNKIRAYNPEIPPYFIWKEKKVFIIESVYTNEILQSNFKPGALKIIDRKKLFLECGDKRLLELIFLQPEGKKVLAASDFINGYRIQEGDVFL